MTKEEIKKEIEFAKKNIYSLKNHLKILKRLLNKLE